jgi:ribonuclease III
VVNRRQPSLDALEQRLGYGFASRALLLQALVHSSYLNEAAGAGAASNERLEFLGDAVIGYVVARELYERFPEAQEGQLTELRAFLVRWETLAEAARRLDLGGYLVLGKGEEQTGGRQRPMNLARVFEALVGAAAEDGTMQETKSLVLRLLRPELESLELTSDVSDIKSRLQTAMQARFGKTPGYHTVGVDGADHARVFRVEVQLDGRVLGEGSGRNKRAAERAAAAQAFARLADEHR